MSSHNWSGGCGKEGVAPELARALDPALTVDLGKSAHKLSLQILSSKLGVIIPALQGFFFLPGGNKILQWVKDLVQAETLPECSCQLSASSFQPTVMNSKEDWRE